MDAKIDWNYEGKTDELMGTGATKAEKAIAYLGGLIVPIFTCIPWHKRDCSLGMVAVDHCHCHRCRYQRRSCGECFKLL